MQEKLVKIKDVLICAIFVLILAGLAGCTSGNLSTYSNSDEPEPAQEFTRETQKEYILQVGDVIDVKFYYNPELNELVTIRPDGKISLQLVDEITAAGLTPVELDRILTKRYSNRLRFIDVSVIVKEFAALKVYVGGEVNSAGPIPYSGKLTVLQAILQAGGYKKTGELRSIVILRNEGTENPLFKVINLQEDLITQTSRNDILLQPYDIVFVPKTNIAKINQFVEQYIKELSPVTLSFGLVYNLNPEVTVK